MILKYRDLFNQEFTNEKYALMKEMIHEKTGQYTGFRLSETPVFLPYSFREKLLYAAESILEQINKIPKETFNKAVPADCFVPNDTDKPHFLCIDFGICRGADGKPLPQLIELQAFPSLYAFEELHRDVVFEVFPFLSELSQRMPYDKLIEIMKEVIVADENPENVILLEVYPEHQKTKIDFKITEDLLHIKTVCLSKIKKRGREIFYENDNGDLVKIKRIYNRVIFDELDRIPDLKTEFDFREEMDVTWVTHPNWFFKISKFLLPKLQHDFVPKSYFLNDFPKNEKVENFVLKPLFSFAGSGVNLHPSWELINGIQDQENFIMQRKVQYAPIFEDPNGDFSKAEIRLLYVWPENEEQPTLMEYLVRMTKAEMVNVDFNKKDAIWIGGTTAFFTED